jgi:hypothetical protein
MAILSDLFISATAFADLAKHGISFANVLKA